MATGDVYRVAIGQTYAGAIKCFNVFHLKVTDGSTDAAAINTEFNNNILPAWRGWANTYLFFDSVQSDRIYPTGGDTAFLPIALAAQQTTGSPLPVVCCHVVTWRTALTGRRGRGRTYFVGGRRQATTETYIFSSTSLSYLLTFITQIWARWGPSGAFTARLGVWSRKNAGGTLPYTADGFNACTSYTLQQYIATMGTRRYGRGV